MQEEPEINDLSEFLREFNRESDRGAALTAAAILDERLAEILKAFFADVGAAKDLLHGPHAPLATFSARTAAAYALGLIQENENREITLIRKIRNEFGHSWRGVSFSSQRVKQIANELPWLGPREYEAKADARGRFNAAVAILLTDLLWRARLVLSEKRFIKQWPNKTR